jgi:hypothetical protein
MTKNDQGEKIKEKTSRKKQKDLYPPAPKVVEREKKKGGEMLNGNPRAQASLDHDVPDFGNASVHGQ